MKYYFVIFNTSSISDPDILKSNPIKQAIASCSSNGYIAYSPCDYSWIIQSSLSPQAIKTKLSKLIHSNIEFIIIEVTKNYATSLDPRWEQGIENVFSGIYIQ